MINHSGQIGGSLREPVTIHNTHIRFKPAKPVKALRLMRAGTMLTFKQADGWVDCTVPQLSDLKCCYAGMIDKCRPKNNGTQNYTIQGEKYDGKAVRGLSHELSNVLDFRWQILDCC